MSRAAHARTALAIDTRIGARSSRGGRPWRATRQAFCTCTSMASRTSRATSRSSATAITSVFKFAERGSTLYEPTSAVRPSTTTLFACSASGPLRPRPPLGRGPLLGVQVRRARVDVVRADERGAAVDDDALRVQRVGALVLAHVDAGADQAVAVLDVAGVREHAVDRAQRVRHDQHVDALAQLLQQEVDELALRHEVRRLDDDRLLRLPQRVDDAVAHLRAPAGGGVEKAHAGDVLPLRRPVAAGVELEEAVADERAGGIVEVLPGVALLRRGDVRPKVGDALAVPERLEVPLGLGGGRAVDVDVAVDEVPLVEAEIRLGQVAPAGDVALPVEDDELLVHAPEDPARMAQRERMVDAYLHAFVAEVAENGAGDVLEIGVDDETHAADAAAAGVAQELECGQGDAVVAGQKVDGVDPAPSLLDDVGARLRGLARIVEDADGVSARAGRESRDDQERQAARAHVRLSIASIAPSPLWPPTTSSRKRRRASPRRAGRDSLPSRHSPPSTMGLVPLHKETPCRPRM